MSEKDERVTRDWIDDFVDTHFTPEEKQALDNEIEKALEAYILPAVVALANKIDKDALAIFMADKPKCSAKP